MTARRPDASARRAVVVLKLLVERAGRIDRAGTRGSCCVRGPAGKAILSIREEDVDDLLARGFLQADGGHLVASEEGRAWYRRKANETLGFLAQHKELERIAIETGPTSRSAVYLDLAESPLAWLRTRKDKFGAPLISDIGFTAGERLRADVTRGQMLPRVTANWDATVAKEARGNGVAWFSDTTIAARERVKRALAAVGPELSGILLDVCCFLKGLETVERDRRWPPRTAKIVLSLALSRLAAHYGLSSEARGPERGRLAGWRSPDAKPRMTVADDALAVERRDDLG